MAYELNHSSWTEFKAIAVTGKNLLVQFSESASVYSVFAVDTQVVHKVEIAKTSPPSSDQTDFETNYKLTANRFIFAITNADKELLVHDQHVIDKLVDVISSLDIQIVATNPLQFVEIANVNRQKKKKKAIIKIGGRVLMLNTEKPNNMKWLVTSWDGSAEGKGFYEIFEVDTTGVVQTLVEGFESTTGWTKSGKVNVLITDTDKTQGSFAFKAVLGFSSGGIQNAEKITKSYAPVLDLSNFSELAIDCKCSLLNTSLTIKLFQGASSYEFADQPVSVGVYGEIKFDLGEIIGFDKTAIDKMEIKFLENIPSLVDETIFIDNLRGIEGVLFSPIDYFFAGAYIPFQQLFPTAINIVGNNKSVRIYVTNREGADKEFEVGFNGREINV